MQRNLQSVSMIQHLSRWRCVSWCTPRPPTLHDPHRPRKRKIVSMPWRSADILAFAPRASQSRTPTPRVTGYTRPPPHQFSSNVGATFVIAHWAAICARQNGRQFLPDGRKEIIEFFRGLRAIASAVFLSPKSDLRSSSCRISFALGWYPRSLDRERNVWSDPSNLLWIPGFLRRWAGGRNSGRQ